VAQAGNNRQAESVWLPGRALGAELRSRRVAPCIDFAHLHARSGEENSYEEFTGQLKRIENKLGWSGLENIHIHVSGIEYGQKGERRHLRSKKLT